MLNHCSVPEFASFSWKTPAPKFPFMYYFSICSSAFTATEQGNTVLVYWSIFGHLAWKINGTQMARPSYIQEVSGIAASLIAKHWRSLDANSAAEYSSVELGANGKIDSRVTCQKKWTTNQQVLWLSGHVLFQILRQKNKISAKTRTQRLLWKDNLGWELLTSD